MNHRKKTCLYYLKVNSDGLIEKINYETINEIDSPQLFYKVNSFIKQRETDNTPELGLLKEYEALITITTQEKDNGELQDIFYFYDAFNDMNELQYLLKESKENNKVMNKIIDYVYYDLII